MWHKYSLDSSLYLTTSKHISTNNSADTSLVTHDIHQKQGQLQTQEKLTEEEQ